LPRTQDFNIRYVKDRDYPYIVAASKKLVETVIPGKPFQEDKIKDIFDVALANDTYSGIILVDPEDNPRGFILAVIDELYFHHTKVAVCLTIWIDPDCRNHSLDMLKALESWAEYKKAEMITLSSFSNLSPKSFDKVLSRLKYTPQEVVHWKEV